ncbi:hypothetical protein, partial [Aeromicrobium sp.]
MLDGSSLVHAILYLGHPLVEVPSAGTSGRGGSQRAAVLGRARRAHAGLPDAGGWWENWTPLPAKEISVSRVVHFEIQADDV